MTDVLKHEPDTFCWTDLATTDPTAATKFYSGLFGWETRDMPTTEGGVYTLLLIEGKEACALYAMMPDQKKQGIPPNWMAFIAVGHIEEVTRKIQAAGGRVLHEAFEVEDAGRMAVIQDPTGAHFSLWEAKKHIGARIQEVPGSVCWRELLTQNQEQAGKFYATVFGWTVDTKSFGENYTLFNKGEQGIGGMITIPGAPACWLTYWIVENCEATAALAKRLGGQIMKEPTKIPNIGTFAVLTDPQGAAFAIMQGER